MATLTYPFGEVPASGETREVVPGVYWLRMPLPFNLDHINLWLLTDGDGWTVVDSGIRSRSVREIWEGLFQGFMGGRPVRRLICTHHHPDHFGLAGWFTERQGSMLWMARAEYFMGRSLVLDARNVPPPEIMDYFRRAGMDDKTVEAIQDEGYSNLQKIIARPPAAYRRLRDGETVAIGGHDWRVVSGRGHSPEHVCLYCADHGVLISGDQVLPRISSNVSVGPTEPEANPLADWLDSLHRFKELPDDLLVLPAHNEPFYGLHTRLDDMIEGHRTRLRDVENLCNEPMTAAGIMPALFRRKLEGIDIHLALGETLAHLHYLVTAKQLTVEQDGTGVRRFRRAAPARACA